jgi:hypothetical protein
MGWAFKFEFYPERKRGAKSKNIKNIIYYNVSSLSHESQYSKRTFNQFNSTSFLCLSITSHQLNFKRHMSYVWFEVRDDCSCCWYWWNGWPFLFKLIFIIWQHSLMDMCYFSNNWIFFWMTGIELYKFTHGLGL